MKSKNVKTYIPDVIVDKLELSNNYFSNNGFTYDIPTVIQFCKEKDYKEFDLPLAGIDIGNHPFSIDDTYSFCWHVNRVKNADLKYPIILDYKGFICDGWHRVCKAILEGKTTIKAIRMNDMPKASGKVEDTK